MPKKRKKRRPGRSNMLSQRRRADKAQEVILVEYSITYEPIKNKDFDALPASVKKHSEKLYHKVNSAPKEAIPDLKKLVEDYPHIPMFYNHLASAYSLLGDHRNAEKIILATYQKFPDYLFARLNYAQFCLEYGQLEKIPEILNNTFDLKMLYPTRSEFHISEVVNFNYITGCYFARIGKMEPAKVCCNVLKQLDPESPQARQIGELLEPSFFLDRIKSAIEQEVQRRKGRL